MPEKPMADPADDSHADNSQAEGDGFALSRGERTDVDEKSPPRAAVLHEIIRRAGEVELNRSIAALAWSALAAGLSMGFSVVARGVLHRYMEGAPAAALIEGFGYSFGFLVVIVSRQQLFTENTMTAVLPMMTSPSMHKLGCLLRLWSVVLLGNLVGVALFAWGLLHLDQFDVATQKAFVSLGEALMQNSPWQMFTKGILAGWLISTMVWMLAASEHSKALVIILATYVIAIGGFTHIIVGSVETLYLVFADRLSMADYTFVFALPTLAGNIVGGSLIFALISHAQVRSDI